VAEMKSVLVNLELRLPAQATMEMVEDIVKQSIDAMLEGVSIVTVHAEEKEVNEGG